MVLGSPATRAASGFFYGGLLTVLAIVALPPLFGVIGGALSTLEPLVRVARLAVAPIALMAGGAAAASSLGRGRRGLYAVVAGAAIAGLLLAGPIGLVAGLTGYEPTLALVAVPTLSFALAFGIDAAVVAAALCGRRAATEAAGWGAAGGVIGGLSLVLPALLSRTPLGAALAPAWALVQAICSAAGFVVPLTIVGWSVARALDRRAE